MNSLQKKSKSLKNRKGFTLIELIVVIVIIGILAAIIIPRFANVTESADRAAAQANQQTVVTAVQMFMADNAGDLPTNSAADQAAVLEFVNGGELPADVGVTYVADGSSVTITSTVDGVEDIVLD